MIDDCTNLPQREWIIIKNNTKSIGYDGKSQRGRYKLVKYKKSQGNRNL